ncbi:hypothetical protein DRO97_04180 [Archaeoglobales archaeon]|nr:MAG: hypothetical protein DRO97_04180 [Archaeoglobales archaeon]
MRKCKYIIIFLMAAIMLATPAMGAKIIKFNNETADTHDQVSYLVLGKNLEGNVTVQFTNGTSTYGYRLTTTAHKLVITFTVNLSNQTGNYSYVATGDTTNLTVTRNPTNLTFNYTNLVWTAKNVNITMVNLTFNYSKGLKTAQGIDTGTVMTDSAVLAYVSNASATDYTTSTTPEKITYIVYDPATVYKYTGYIKSSDGNVTVYITGDELDINLTKAKDNKVRFEYTLQRYNYSDTKVPIHKAYFSVYLNDTYFTNLVPVPSANVTDIGLSESGQYTKATFLDTKPAYNSSFYITCYAWSTNGSIEDGYKFQYDINPVGGPTATSTHTKNVTVVLPAAMVAPPVALYWWQYEFYGISVLAWMGIIAIIAIIALFVYRRAKGLPMIPRGLGGQMAIVGMFIFLAILSQLQQWFSDAWTWVQQNYVAIGVGIVLAFILLLMALWQFGRD